MIVKVKLPLRSTDRAVVHNKTKSVIDYWKISTSLREAMGRDREAYFKARLLAGRITLIRKLPPWQSSVLHF